MLGGDAVDRQASGMKSKKMKRERSNGKLTKNRQEKLDSRIEQKKIRLRTFAVRSMKHTEKMNFICDCLLRWNLLRSWQPQNKNFRLLHEFDFLPNCTNKFCLFLFTNSRRFQSQNTDSANQKDNQNHQQNVLFKFDD